jgi:hypothetical protein
MPSLEMPYGPYALDEDTINEIVLEDYLGNYALGYEKDHDNFVVKYVGRGNVHDRLTDHLDDEHNQPAFKFSYAEAETDKKAEVEIYIKECKNYHDFYYDKKGVKQLTNREHPKLPKGKKCPYCSHIGQ